MLARLSIRDIVLIDKLDLDFSVGLSVLTGETGAGKSILLDSLGLALGARGDRALVRSGQDFGQVTAVFDLPRMPGGISTLLDQAGIEPEDDLILRRRVMPDGRTKAWVNDQAVSQGLLSAIGAQLLEVHGQNADRGLLDANTHRQMLDDFAGHSDLVADVAASWRALRVAQKALFEAEQQLEQARADEEYLRHSVEELEKFHPTSGEETELADARAKMMQGERLAGELSDLEKELSDRGGVDATVRGLARKLDRQDAESQALLAPIADCLDRAAIELSEAATQLSRLQSELDFDPRALEDTEERLFELRRLARKHNVVPDQLADTLADIQTRLKALDAGEDAVDYARQNMQAAAQAYDVAVAALSKSRLAAAGKLDAAVMAELPPLRLDKAKFRTSLIALSDEERGAYGAERVQFDVQTNPGSDFGPLAKIASGGETARFILALKVVLAGVAAVPVMVFDEVDRGIGGPTAAAVADRLHRLSKTAQVLLVTHSPQVAARGDHQYMVQKFEVGGETRTSLAKLGSDDRIQEIARMLSGAELTDAARTAARDLLGV